MRYVCAFGCSFVAAVTLTMAAPCAGQDESIRISGVTISFVSGEPVRGSLVKVYLYEEQISKKVEVGADGAFSLKVNKQPAVAVLVRHGSRLTVTDGLSAFKDQNVFIAVRNDNFETEAWARMEAIAWSRLIQLREKEDEDGEIRKLFTAEEIKARLSALKRLMRPMSKEASEVESLIEAVQ